MASGLAGRDHLLEMHISRRKILGAAPVLAGAAAAAGCVDGDSESTRNRIVNGEWERVRAEFRLLPDIIDLSALLIASHPRTVREAIEKYRSRLDENPTVYLTEDNDELEDRTLERAAGYLRVRSRDIALTDSTTAGLGLLYNGFQLRLGEEFLTTEQDYYATREALRLAGLRTGATVRTISLYRDIHSVSADELVESLRSAIRPETRVAAVTWVHSGTGLKLPIRRIADALGEINRERDREERLLLCVDGVHGFGVEDADMRNLGCDFFVAGCHKWLFGPRGTGLMWGKEEAWTRVLPTIPTFRERSVRQAWLHSREPDGPVTGATMTPGGFKPFEHVWALAEAFEFHQRIGKAEVAARTHELSRQLKEGLAAMPHVKLYTPMAEDLSAGIVCFDVDGMSPPAVIARLKSRGIIATITPYAPTYARLTPSIRNSPAEIETVLREIRAFA